MVIGKRTVARKLSSYLRRRITLDQLVDWSERAMMEAEFSQADLPVVRDVVGRLGVADVRAFGLLWEDCGDMLRRLGYAVHLDIVAR
jgi:cobyrinic acid a,c-diamide synthase